MNEALFSLRYFQRINGKEAWVAGTSAIGPYTTTDPAEALTFPTAQAAMGHPAFAHPLCLTEVAAAPLRPEPKEPQQ